MTPQPVVLLDYYCHDMYCCISTAVDKALKIPHLRKRLSFRAGLPGVSQTTFATYEPFGPL